MDGLRYELTATWKEVRWTLYFLVLLLPAVLIAAGLAALIQRTPSPSAGLLLALGIPSAILALVGAGLWDGMMGRLGRYVWWPLLFWLALTLLRALARHAQATTGRERPGEEPEPNGKHARPGGPPTPNKPLPGRLRERLQAGGDIACWLRDRRMSWREMWRLRAHLSKGSSDPCARELQLLIEQ